MYISAMVFEIGVPVAKTTPRPPLSLADVAGLHEHVEGAVAVGVRQARDAVHLRGVEEILVEVGFVDEDLIDAQFLEGDARCLCARGRRAS